MNKNKFSLHNIKNFPFFGPENDVCFLRLLHIFKCTPDYTFIIAAYNMSPDQTAVISSFVFTNLITGTFIIAS